jgi:hypothetical protein
MASGICATASGTTVPRWLVRTGPRPRTAPPPPRAWPAQRFPCSPRSALAWSIGLAGWDRSPEAAR